MKEAFRKLGVGKALFGQLGKIAQEKVWIFIPGHTRSFIAQHAGVSPSGLDSPQGE